MPKPAHLTREYAARFQNQRVVDLYHLRLPYPPEVFETLLGLIRRYSTMQNHQPFDLIAELEQRHLFQTVGRWTSAPVTSRQPVENYIASFHSCSSLSRDHMPPANAAAFDQELGEAVRPWRADGLLELQTVGGVVWGTPISTPYL